MKFLEAHIYQSRRGSSCSRVFGLASAARLTNCLWIASSKAPSTPFCHCLLTNAPRLPLPDTCLLPTFCSLLSDGLLCIISWLTMSRFISTAAGSPASHRVIPHSQLWSASILPNAFSLSSFELGLCCKRFVLFSQFSQCNSDCTCLSLRFQWCCEVKSANIYWYKQDTVIGWEQALYNLTLLKVMHAMILRHKKYASSSICNKNVGELGIFNFV